MRALLLTLAAITFPAVASAGEGMTIGVAGGGLWFDDLEVLGSTWYAAPRLAWHYDDTIAIEGDIGILSGKTRVGDFNYLGITPRVNLVGNLAPDQRIQPLLVVGPGLFYKSTDDNDALGVDYVNPDIDALFNGGPAVQAKLTDKLLLRTDYRVVVNLGTESFQNRGDSFINWEWTLGLGYRFGGKPDQDKDGIVDEDEKPECIDKPEDIDQFEDEDGCPDYDNDNDGVEDVADGCPIEAEDADGFSDEDGCPDPDNDGDGVLDAADICPDTAGKVDGCPDGDGDGLADDDDDCPEAAGPEEQGGCPDKDEDGVADIEDTCPEEKGPANAEGCPDADSDRIPDIRDECKDEPVDPRVNPRRSNGCPKIAFFAKGELIILKTIQFKTGGNELQGKETTETLDAVAKALTKFKKVKKVEVQGHTDSDGDDAKNLELSQGRAEAVKAWLVNVGIDEARLVAKGYGETKPVAPNDTAESKAKNRRVQFIILEDDFKEPGSKRKGRRGQRKGKKGGAKANPEGGAGAKAEDKPADKPAEKAEDKPAEKAEDKPAEK